MDKLSKFLKKHWLITIIIILAAFLRLYRISDYMEFLGDQGRDVVIISDFLKTGNLFFIGPQTSIGNMHLGPYFYYLIAPSLLLANFSPVGPSIFIALINIATVWLVYFVSKKWFNLNTAHIAAFLYAISPVAIKYSTFIWNPNIMPFFSLLFIYFFFEAINQKNYRYFIYASLSFVMIINSHYLGLSLLPLVGIYWLISLIKLIRSKSKKLSSFIINTLLAFLVFGLSLIPQTMFEIKHGWPNTQALIKFFTERETTVNIKPYKAIPEMWPLFTQFNTRLLAGKNLTAGIILTIIFAVSLVFFIIKKDKKPKNFWVILYWYIIGLVSLALYKQHIYDHYFGFLYPSIFILFAYLITRLKYFGLIIILFSVTFSVIENPFRWQPNRQLAVDTQIVQSIIDKSNNQDFNFALLAKMNYDPPYQYIMSQKKAKVVTLQNQITEQLFVVCEPFQMNCDPINNPLWEIAAFGWAKVDSEWEISGNKVFKLVHLSPQK